MVGVLSKQQGLLYFEHISAHILCLYTTYAYVFKSSYALLVHSTFFVFWWHCSCCDFVYTTKRHFVLPCLVLAVFFVWKKARRKWMCIYLFSVNFFRSLLHILHSNSTSTVRTEEWVVLQRVQLYLKSAYLSEKTNGCYLNASQQIFGNS